MTNGNVLGLFAPPCRMDSLRAVSRTLLRIRAGGETCEEIASKLCCCADTIENASNERTLLSFDAVARLAYHYPDEFALVEELWTCRPVTALTAAERVERAMNELRAVRKEIAA